LTKISFYILPTDTLDSKDLFAIKFCKQFWRKGKNLYCVVENREVAEKIDSLLWETSDSFIPHAIEDEKQKLTSKPIEVGIGWNIPKHRHGILINLTNNIPKWFAHFDNLVEIVVQQSDVLAASRKNWNFLTDLGYEIKSFDLRK